MAGLGWDSAVHKGEWRIVLLYHVLIAYLDETYLTANQEVSVAMASLSYTLLAAISLLGSVRFVPPNTNAHIVFRLIGTVIRHRTFISLYSRAVWSHLAFNITAGAYFIFTLFHRVSDDDLSNCVASYIGDLISQYVCAKEFEIYRGVIISIYVVFCLFELCASSCLSLSTSPQSLTTAHD